MINLMKVGSFFQRFDMRAVAVKSRDEKAFTIVELLIATSVFSVVLLVALAGFLQIGHLFYKGVSTTQTATVANQIFSDISGNFHNSGNISSLQSANGYTYYCLGGNRYTLNIGFEVHSSDAPDHLSPSQGGNFGLLKDSLPGSSGCATPCDDISGIPCPPGAVKFNNPSELLGNQMRLSALNIQPDTSISPNYYSISIVVAYGDTDLLDNPSSSSAACKNNTAGTQYCSVTALNTGIYLGLQ